VVEVGKSIAREITVDDARVINFMGPELRVYATPSILWDVELACRELLKSMLPEEQDSVGSQVLLDHLGAAPLGAKVALSANITSVENRKVIFSASVNFNGREIARANHTRTIVVMEDLKARIAKLTL
jgi:fluoroacetyl-CoA thioesterase